jgi:hypothetical protein
LTAAVTESDVDSYLAATGWAQRPEGWRGAAIWEYGNSEVLVPPPDVDDSGLRLRELIGRLAAIEHRDPSDVERDIASPLTDQATYNMSPAGADGATTTPSLAAGARLVEGIRQIVSTAARTVVEGPQLVFAGHAPAPVAHLLRTVCLSTARRPGFGLTIGMPHTLDQNLGRLVATQMYDATTAIEESLTEAGGLSLDQIAAAGVSVDFCTALSDLAGDGREEPFQLGFRWAHGSS